MIEIKVRLIYILQDRPMLPAKKYNCAMGFESELVHQQANRVVGEVIKKRTGILEDIVIVRRQEFIKRVSNQNFQSEEETNNYFHTNVDPVEEELSSWKNLNTEDGTNCKKDMKIKCSKTFKNSQ